MEKKYVYFDTNSPVIHLSDLDKLKELYYNILNKEYLENNIDNIDNDFYKNMFDDGYFIIQLMETEIIYFFIDLDKIDNIYNDIKDEKDIIQILNDKLKNIK